MNPALPSTEAERHTAQQEAAPGRTPGRARQKWLVAALVASLALTAWTWQHQQMRAFAPTSEATTIRALPPSGAQRVVPQVGEVAASPRDDAPDATAETLTDPFRVTAWEPPVPPAPPPPPPPTEVAAPAPVAPPLPFQYVGRQELAGGPASATEYYLARDGRALTVRAGDRIGEEYRFDGDDGQGALQFMYLPLGTQQALPIGETK